MQKQKQEQSFKFIIFILCVILFSGLGVSSYSEGLGNSVVSGNSIVSGNSNKSTISSENPNYIYVVLFLVIMIVWLLIIKQ